MRRWKQQKERCEGGNKKNTIQRPGEEVRIQQSTGSARSSKSKQASKQASRMEGTQTGDCGCLAWLDLDEGIAWHRMLPSLKGLKCRPLGQAVDPAGPASQEERTANGHWNWGKTDGTSSDRLERPCSLSSALPCMYFPPSLVSSAARFGITRNTTTGAELGEWPTTRGGK